MFVSSSTKFYIHSFAPVGLVGSRYLANMSLHPNSKAATTLWLPLPTKVCPVYAEDAGSPPEPLLVELREFYLFRVLYVPRNLRPVRLRVLRKQGLNCGDSIPFERRFRVLPTCAVPLKPAEFFARPVPRSWPSSRGLLRVQANYGGGFS